jgi:hypothetical protein
MGCRHQKIQGSRFAAPPPSSLPALIILRRRQQVPRPRGGRRGLDHPLRRVVRISRRGAELAMTICPNIAGDIIVTWELAIGSPFSAWTAPQPTPVASLPRQVPANISTTFRQGLADRQAWETWLAPSLATIATARCICPRSAACRTPALAPRWTEIRLLVALPLKSASGHRIAAASGCLVSARVEQLPHC